MENRFDHLFMLLFIVSAREQTFWYPIPTDQTRQFSVERWKNEACKGKNGGKVVYFPPKSAFFLFVYYDWSTFPYFVPLLGVKTLMFPAKEKVEIGEMKVLEKDFLISFWLSVDCTDCD